MADIKNMRIAVLATDGVEQVELTGPSQALRDAGAEVTLVSLRGGDIQGMNHDEKGDKLKVDATLDRVSVPMWLIILSDQLTIVALVSLYLTN